jgi:deoxyribonuclease V
MLARYILIIMNITKNWPDVITDLDINSFNVGISEAKLIQKELCRRLILSGYAIKPGDKALIGGADVSFAESVNGNIFSEENPSGFRSVTGSRFRSKRTLAIAGIVIIDTETGKVVDKSVAVTEIDFPYIPGYLSFREGPALIEAFRELSTSPGVMIYDGCGIAHPRGLGLASHMGILTGIPSIGCAKSLLCGTVTEPWSTKGERTDIILGGITVGKCLRTKDHIKPVFVSPGHLFGVEDAAETVLTLAKKYRLPEPTRLAHNYVTAEKKLLAHTIR